MLSCAFVGYVDTVTTYYHVSDASVSMFSLMTGSATFSNGSLCAGMCCAINYVFFQFNMFFIAE